MLDPGLNRFLVSMGSLIELSWWKRKSYAGPLWLQRKSLHHMDVVFFTHRALQIDKVIFFQWRHRVPYKLLSRWRSLKKEAKTNFYIKPPIEPPQKLWKTDWGSDFVGADLFEAQCAPLQSIYVGIISQRVKHLRSYILCETLLWLQMTSNFYQRRFQCSLDGCKWFVAPFNLMLTGECHVT